MFDDIPKELKDIAQWCVWKYGKPKDNGNVEKIPLNPETGVPCTDITDYTTFDKAIHRYYKLRTNNAGIGFNVLNTGYYCIDIDSDRTQDAPQFIEDIKNGTFTGKQGETVKAADSYTEISQSGKGLHIFVKGKKPKGKSDFELYDGRFIAMTGDCIHGAGVIRQATKRLENLIYDNTQVDSSAEIPLVNTGLKESRIIKTAEKAANGEDFKTLFYAGENQGYDSELAKKYKKSSGEVDRSRVDAVLLEKICFAICVCAEKKVIDIDLTDTIFRKSALYRDKWERKDYREDSIKSAGEFAAALYDTTYKAVIDFSDNYVDTVGVNWLDIIGNTELELDRKGNIIFNNMNVIKILLNDDEFNGIAYDEFSERIVIKSRDGVKPFTDNALLRVLGLLVCKYYTHSKISKELVYDCVQIVAHIRKFNAVLEYFENLPKWDNVKRVETLLIDYFGVEDNIFTRECITKTLLAVRHRVEHAPTKFDNMLILKGKEGTGKSTFFRKLAIRNEWFIDTLKVTEIASDIKTTGEKIQGKLFAELAELAGRRNAENEGVKQILSAQTISFRSAYGRLNEDKPIKNVFVATTNDPQPIYTDTGNRRFWIVEVNEKHTGKKPWDMTEYDIQQIWAEICEMYNGKHNLLLSDKAKEIQEQNVKSSQDLGFEDYVGLAKKFLDIPITDNWNDLTVEQKRAYCDNYLDNNSIDKVGTVKRTCIKAVEFYRECSEVFPNSRNVEYNRHKHGDIIKRILAALGWKNTVKNGVRAYYRQEGK